MLPAYSALWYDCAMGRSFTYNALALRVRQSGESNREAFFLTPEEGIIRAMVFGGPKSKLRAYVSPYHSGTLWIYRDPVKDSRKVSDFDVSSWRPGIREVYERTMAAGAVAETILAGHGGGGNWQEAFDLANLSLDAIAAVPPRNIYLPLLHFLWNWAEILGIRPELNHCESCGSKCPEDMTVWYSRYDGSIICAGCGGVSNAGSGDSFLPIGSGARRWLNVAGPLKPELASRYGMDSVSLGQVKDLTGVILSAAFGRRLRSWDM